MPVRETITLYFREGSSDKFYTATLESVSTLGHRVTFVYGRIGTSGTSGEKCSEVSYAEAKSIYDKLVQSKLAKGYKPDAHAVSYAGIGDKKDTGVRPQLLKPVGEDMLERLLSDPAYCAQEKYDGHRKLMEKKTKSGDIISINRKGQEVGYPDILEKAARKIEADTFLIDGEEIGTTYYVFDLLSCNKDKVAAMGYSQRHMYLETIIPENSNIKLAPVYCTVLEKRELLQRLKREGKEGIVFKRLDAVYSINRSDDQIKFKFYHTASCIVVGVNVKRSIAIGIIDTESDNEVIRIGNCLVPVNYDIPKIGDVVEIRYLYAYKGGSLYQPIYQGVRNDLDQDDCTIDQIHYKTEIEED